jgi:hypothetical protein
MDDLYFDNLMKEIDHLCDAVMNRYNTTPATAAECFEQLTDALMNMDMMVEPDCVGMWQVLNDMKNEEGEWDRLSAEEQAGRNVPKGKQMKTIG